MGRIKWTKEDFMQHVVERRSPFDRNMNGVNDANEMIQQLMVEAQTAPPETGGTANPEGMSL